MISEGFFLSVLVKKTQKKNTQKKLIFQFKKFPSKKFDFFAFYFEKVDTFELAKSIKKLYFFTLKHKRKTQKKINFSI